MDIPLMPLRMRRREMISSDIILSGASVSMADDIINYEGLLSSVADAVGKDVPIVAVDVKGIQRKDIDQDILKKIRTKREFWLMTGIRNTGDLMDAFQGDIGKAVVPYQFTTDELLREMTEISDCCIPALFVDDGGVLAGRKRKDLRGTVRTMEEMNFRKILMFDVSGGDGIRLCEYAAGISDALIPFIASNRKEDIDSANSLGFRDVIVPAVSLPRT